MAKVAKSKYEKFQVEYVENGKTLKQIASDFGLSYATLRNHAGKEKWSAKRKKYKEKRDKKVAEITEQRIIEEAETLTQKDARRAMWWKRMQEAVQGILLQAQYLDADGKTRLALKPKEIQALTKAYESACRGERLEDAQPIEIARVEKQADRDEFFDALAELEERNMELEEELAKAHKQNKKYENDGKKNRGSGKNSAKDDGAKV